MRDGPITPERPIVWGTDTTGVWTEREGMVTGFAAIDHATAECVGIHAARYGTRFEALEPTRQGVRKQSGSSAPSVTQGLLLWHDHASQFVSDHFQTESACLGIGSSPAIVRVPEGNGWIERFLRTLKEQLLWGAPP